MENFSGFFYRDKESGASSLKYIPESEHKRILETSELMERLAEIERKLNLSEEKSNG